VVDDALDARIVVHVSETCMSGVLQHDRRLRLFPIRALPVSLHAHIMYHFIISRTSNECVVLRNSLR
jgi:hypothetical protein